MSTLSEKRAFYYHNQHNQPNSRVALENIQLNSDEVEGFLSEIVVNTNHAAITTDTPFVFNFVGSGTQETSVIDITAASGIYKFHWTGTESSQQLTYVVWVSSDNITFYPFASALFLKINGFVSCEFDTVFRYHKVIVTNNTGAAQTTTLIYAGRH
tara:strand:- start:367 stop:834 length:468 start_codon:yes stop_codon:yes gene_type:complete